MALQMGSRSESGIPVNLLEQADLWIQCVVDWLYQMNIGMKLRKRMKKKKRKGKAWFFLFLASHHQIDFAVGIN